MQSTYTFLIPYYANVSDVPRSLQSRVSTIQTVVLTADVFQFLIEFLRVRHGGLKRHRGKVLGIPAFDYMLGGCTPASSPLLIYACKY